MKKIKVLPKFPHQFFYFTGLRIRRLLYKLSVCLVPSPIAVYEKAQGFWVSRAIVAACELNLADHLASGAKNISELANLSNTNETNLYRLMRTLAGEGIFREMQGKMFVNTRLSSALKEGDNSMKYMILHQFGTTSMMLFTHFTECVRTGEGNPRKILGKEIFQYLEENPVRNIIYNKAMDNSSEMSVMALLSAYNFKGIKTLADIGGGHGILLSGILEKYKGIHGILFDQKHVIGEENQLLPDNALQDRLRITSGNFFDDIPAGADAYLMKNVMHAFSDDNCMKLLRKIHSVMATDGRLIILETVIRPDNAPFFGKLVDLQMMAGTEGGKERTREEFTDLFQRSGFRLTKITSTIAPFSVLEVRKK